MRGQRVLELGCGLASLSHICATLGAATVVATDGEDTTVMAARTVAKAASLVSRSEDASCKPNIDSIEFSTLRWGNVTAIEALGDGHGGSGAGGFDLVLGTELMYYATVVDALVATIATALRRSAIDPSLEAPRKVPACAVLSHFFRRADLSQELVAACHEHGTNTDKYSVEHLISFITNFTAFEFPHRIYEILLLQDYFVFCHYSTKKY